MIPSGEKKVLWQHLNHDDTEQKGRFFLWKWHGSVFMYSFMKFLIISCIDMI